MIESSDKDESELTASATPDSASPERAPVAEPPAGAHVRASTLARLLEWFWRGKALREARGPAAGSAPENTESFRRAALAAEAGRRMLEPSPPFAVGSADAIACELYRQSIFWALVAGRGGGPGSELRVAEDELTALWESAEPELLKHAAGDEQQLEVLGRVLPGATFVTFAQLEPEQSSDLGWRLRRFAEALFESLSETQRRVDALWFQRTVRLTGFVIVCVALLVGVWYLPRLLENDLASGKPWRASSVGYSGCVSPEQHCGTGFFFHTALEANPWVEIDLGKTRSFSRVRIRNRTDCCRERAVPLTVKVSKDGKTFREVGRQEDVFTVWTAVFKPVSARYVRVQAARRTQLHLNEVAVLE